MGTLNKVLAERYTAPAPAPPPSPLVPQVIVEAARRPGPLPKGRLSRTASDLAFGWFWSPETLLAESRQEVIRRCREACRSDSDASGAARDLIALANPGYTVQFTGSDRATAQAKREIDDLGTRLGDFPNWDALIDHQLAEAYEAGAGSVEAYPTPSRSGVAGVEIVPAEEVSILRAGNARVYRQAAFGVDLDPRTYIYTPYGQRGRDPHGTPALLSALVELERKAQLILGTDKIVRMMSEGAFLQLGVPKPTIAELGVQSEQDPDYVPRLQAWYTAYVQIATQARDRGVMVTEAGVDSKAIPITGNVQGVSQLQDVNNLRLWSGLMTLPFMRGKMDSTTQALAQVVYPILLAHALDLQAVARSVVEFVMNLHLRLCGIAASVTLEFLNPPNPFELAQAQAAKEHALADSVYMEQLGDEYVRQVAARLDLDPEKVLAWRVANKPAPPPVTLKEDVKTTGGDPP